MKKDKLKFKNKLLNYFFILGPVWKSDKPLVISLVLGRIIQHFSISVGELIFLGLIINRISQDITSIPQVIMLTCLVFVIDVFAQMFLPVFNAHFIVPHTEKYRIKVNNEIFNRLKKTDYKYFDDPDFYDRFTVTYSRYANKSIAALNDFSTDVASVFTLVSLITLFAILNWWIIIISLASSLLHTFVSIYSNKIDKEKEDSIALYERKAEYFNNLLVSHDAAMDIKSTNVEDIFISNYCESVESIIRINKKTGLKQLLCDVYDSLISISSGSLIRVISCFFVLWGRINIGYLATLILGSSNLSRQFSKLSSIASHYNKYSIEGERIRRFLEMPSPIEQAQNEKSDNVTIEDGFDIVFKNVSFSYPNSDFKLKNINMHFKSGNKIAIVGENGGGKTTITKLLLRLYDPQEGDILLNGRPLKEYDIDAVRHQIGIAFQDCPVYSLTVRENLSVYNDVNDYTIDQISKILPINEILRKNDANYDSQITKRFDKNGIVLSGGEKQKLSVARVMITNFSMLIFDEPTSALDPISEEKLSEAILSAGNKSTTILISHRLSNVVNADIIYVIKDGEIIESGTHKELMMANGYYSEMFSKQAKPYIST